MPKIENLNSANRALVLNAIEEALTTVSDRFDIAIRMDGYQYDTAGRYFKPKLLVAVKGETGEFESPAAIAFNANAAFYGLKPEDLGRVFSQHGTAYKITGLAPNASRYPILAERVHDGKGFKFTADGVKDSLERAA